MSLYQKALSEAEESFNSFIEKTNEYKKNNEKNTIANVCQFVGGENGGFIRNSFVFCPITNKVPNCSDSKYYENSPNNYSLDNLPKDNGSCSYIPNRFSTPLSSQKNTKCTYCPSGYIYDGNSHCMKPLT